MKPPPASFTIRGATAVPRDWTLDLPDSPNSMVAFYEESGAESTGLTISGHDGRGAGKLSDKESSIVIDRVIAPCHRFRSWSASRQPRGWARESRPWPTPRWFAARAASGRAPRDHCATDEPDHRGISRWSPTSLGERALVCSRIFPLVTGVQIFGPAGLCREHSPRLSCRPESFDCFKARVQAGLREKITRAQNCARRWSAASGGLSIPVRHWRHDLLKR